MVEDIWTKSDATTLQDGVNRALRLSDLMGSPVGEDVRQVLISVGQRWLNKIKEGDPHAFAALKALDDVADAFELVMTIGQSMQAELVRRQGGRKENGNARESV